VGPRADLDGQREANISYHMGLRNPDSLARSKSPYQLRYVGPQTVVIKGKGKVIPLQARCGPEGG
jgi:hypothetical protein